MKVTLVLPGYVRSPSGGARIIYTHASGLVRRGHDVTILHAAHIQAPWRVTAAQKARSMAGRVRDRLAGPPRSVTWHPVDERVRMRYVPVLRPDRIPEGDVVVATAWATVDPVLAAPPCCGGRVYFLQGYETWLADREVVDATWRAPMRKIVVSKWLAQIGRDLGVADAHYVPYGMDPGMFPLLRPPGGRDLQVAMAYSSSRVKGGDVGLAAILDAKARLPELRAVLFGVGPRPMGIPRWIRYERDPSLPRLVEIYNDSAIFLCSSRAEGWGLPSMEAMSCGCALVTTDNGGSREFAVHNSTALVAPVDDATTLAEHIVRLGRDRGLREATAKAGREKAVSFRWEDSFDRFEQVLQQAAREASTS